MLIDKSNKTTFKHQITSESNVNQEELSRAGYISVISLTIIIDANSSRHTNERGTTGSAK